MIKINQGTFSGEHAKIPAQVRSQYSMVPELADYIEVLAVDSSIEFETWQDAYAMALDMMVDAGNLNIFPAEHYPDVANNMRNLLAFMKGKLLRASTIRNKAGVEVSSDHELRVAKHIGKFEDKNFLRLYRMSSRNETEPNPNRQYIHSDIIAMMLADDIGERFKNYCQLKTLNSAMNCEEFLALCFISLKLIDFNTIKTIIKACQKERSYILLHQAYNLDSAEVIGEVDLSKLDEFRILFELNRMGQAAHVALLSTDGYVYELGFGTSESEFRVLKTEADIFIESSKRREKLLLATTFDADAVQRAYQQAENLLDKSRPKI